MTVLHEKLLEYQRMMNIKAFKCTWFRKEILSALSLTGEYKSNNEIPLRQSQTISGFVTSLLLFFRAIYVLALWCLFFFFKTRLGMLLNGISAFSSLFLPFFLSNRLLCVVIMFTIYAQYFFFKKAMLWLALNYKFLQYLKFNVEN